MDELFRMMTVRAPQVTTDPNVVTITPKEFRVPPPPLVAQYESYLKANNYADISYIDFSRAGTLTLFPPLKKFVSQTATADPATLDPNTFEASIQTAFGKTAAELTTSADFLSLQPSISDNIVALLIGARQKPGLGVAAPIAHKIVEGVSYARMISLILRLGFNKPDDPFKVAADIQRALQAPVLLPALIFPLINLRDLSIQSLGYGDLLVVKEHIIGYELGEIARIENILSGENSQHQYEHDLTTTNTTVTTTSTTTEDVTELDQTEHLALHNETTNTIQEDLSAKGDVHLSYSGVVNFSANAEVAWSQSKNTATKASTDYAKDVTTRASNKVTRQFSQQVTQQITEVLKDLETHGLSNTTGNHVRGVYQWVTAVYEAQIFSYGNRILLDMLVPEPAAFLRSTAIQQTATAAPTPPKSIGFRPDEILDKMPDRKDFTKEADYQAAFATALPKYYGTLALEWGLTDFEAPPDESMVLTKVVTSSDTGGGVGSQFQTVEMKMKPGFQAKRGRLSATFDHIDGTDDIDSVLWASVGAIDPFLRVVTALVDDVHSEYSANPAAGQYPSRSMGVTEGMIFIKYLGNTRPSQLQNSQKCSPTIHGTVDFRLGYEQKLALANVPGSGGPVVLDNNSPPNTPAQPEPAVQPVNVQSPFFSETDSIALSLWGHNIKNGTVHIEIHCERSPKALADWQGKFFAKIQTVYQKQKQDYDDKVASAQFPSGTSSSMASLGGSPDQNRNTERVELKKSCIQALMTPWNQTLDYNNVQASLPKNTPAAGVALAPPIIAMPGDGFDTMATSLTLSGTGSPGAQVTVSDGGVSFGPYKVQTDGNWHSDTPISLGYGAHILVATQVQDFKASPPSPPASGIVRFPAAPFGVELPYPQPKFPLDPEYARAVRFFEQAFEWENVASFLYPYYWGRKETWYDLTKFGSDDPLHQQFLRAGAARVIVPVRPTFNPDVLFFLITGKLFINGDVPQLGEPDYFPITDEIRAQSDALYDPVPVPDQLPWEIRIPTKFLWLRKDDKKPAWQPRGALNWTPPESPTWSWEKNPNDPFDDGE